MSDIHQNIEIDAINILTQSDRAQNLTPLWPEITAVIVAEVKSNFDRGGPPDGDPWAPSVRAIKTGGKTLVNTGHLLESIGSFVVSEPFFLAVGTDVPYAVEVTTGKGFIPPRPFMQVSQDTVDQIGQMVLDYIFKGDS